MFARRASTLPFAVIRINDESIKRLRPYSLRHACLQTLAKFIGNLCCVGVAVKRDWLPNLPVQVRRELYAEVVAAIEACSLHSVRQQAWLAAFYLFFDNESVQSLQFEEFIGSHVTHTAFLHTLTFHSGLPSLTKVILGSDECDATTLAFVFEITDTEWKPLLKQFLQRAPNLADITFIEFADDDCLAMVGQHCQKLSHLKITISPESSYEQRVTDDGFCDFVDRQTNNESLRCLDLTKCYSNSLTSKTLLYLGHLPSLAEIRIQGEHFQWADLMLVKYPDRFVENQVLRLRLDLPVLNESKRDDYLSIFSRALRIFPNVRRVSLNDFVDHMDVTDEATEHKIALAELGNRVVEASIAFATDIGMYAKLFPNLETAEFVDFRMDAFCRQPFQHLRSVTVIKECFAVLFELMADIMKNVPQLREFTLSTSQLNGATDDKFHGLFSGTRHLKDLEVFSLTCSASVAMKLTERSVQTILDHCPRIRRIDKVLTWGTTIGRLEGLAEEFRVVRAERSHWSLPWKVEDGTYYEDDVIHIP